MKKPLTFVCAGLLALGSSLALAADKPAQEAPEKSVKQSEVPKPVLEAVTKKYPKAKLRKFGQEVEDGKEIYEVELTSGPDDVSIDVSPQGKILAEETTIKPAALPAPVKAGLQASKYKAWKITKAERVIHDEKEDAPAYEVVVQSKKEKFEVVLDMSGKITKEEAKSPRDND
jgi:uncharacterized membrane protein YkoI